VDASAPTGTRPAKAGLVASGITDFEGGVSAIDTHYVRPQMDASHLVVEGGRALFVDTGTSHAVPHLLAALEARSIAPEDVDWVLLTHIHLDHAGGAGALLEHLPNARAVVHPRGASHPVDPSRRIAATREVYGDALYERLYGEIRPIPAERLVLAEDGGECRLATRPLRFLHTPGHALHHVAFHDPEASALYTGDTFGISYRDHDVDGRAFILPTTTPTQFDPAQLHASIDRVAGCGPERVFLTHYSEVRDVARLAGDLHRAVDAFVDIVRRRARDPDPTEAIVAELIDWTWARLDAHGYPGDDAARRAILADDLRLNADGLLAYARRAGR
jgi:glyoxylase-like metal-dependent hydrolase (beta-lactamase superfamily II)